MKWMKNRALRCGIALWMPFALPSAAACAQGDQPAAAHGATVQKRMSDADWAALLDPHAPLADRQRMLAAVEQSAQLDDPQTLYILGSIYHMGRHAPGSPVDEDAEKASAYLSNAAIRGSVLAMAKMAEIKLAAGQYREAMNWAQIYAHYASIAAKRNDVQDSYIAELLYRIKEGLDKSAMDGIMKDVRSFVIAYDSSIQAGIAGGNLVFRLDPHSRTRYLLPAINHERHVDAGMADFLLTFGPDGTVTRAQLMDAEPRLDIGMNLLQAAQQMTLDKSGSNAPRYAWVPVTLGDNLYHLKNPETGK